MKNCLKEINLSQLSEDLAKQIKKEKKEINDFWNSYLCQEMISDILCLNKHLNNEQFYQDPKTFKQKLGWTHLRDEDINLFFKTMADETIGLQSTVEQDENCLFENYQFVKKQIKVVVIHGQGTAIILTPQSTDSFV